MSKLNQIAPVGRRVTEICEKNGYEFLKYETDTGEIEFTSGNVKLTVWLTKMTVRTVMKHPKQGVTQMFRKRCSFDELDAICKNPRVHTGKGYKHKKYEPK